MKVVIADVLTEGEVDDPADCVLGAVVMVRTLPLAEDPANQTYRKGIIVAVKPEE